MTNKTPAMEQFERIKNKYNDCVIFFRMGDFYECFDEDAKIVSENLDITLTTRGNNSEGKRPLAGIPYHAVDNYLPKLVKHGYKVAVCEQLEDPKQVKGVVKRDVVRIVTPGTAIDSSMISDSKNNYLMALSRNNNTFGLAFLDVSTGEFTATQLEDEPPYNRVISEIVRMNPAESIIHPEIYEDYKLVEQIEKQNAIVHQFDSEQFEFENAKNYLKQHFNVSTLDGMFPSNQTIAISSSAAALKYAVETQMRNLDHVCTLKNYTDSEFMVMDSITLKNLEIVKNIHGGSEDTILDVLNKTKTPMGTRLLQKWLVKPLKSTYSINKRLDAVDDFVNNTFARTELRKNLGYIKDIERLIGRVTYGNSNARDLVAMKTSLQYLPEIIDNLNECDQSKLLSTINSKLKQSSVNIESIVNLIRESIVDEPPLSVREGGLIKSGYNEELDKLRDASSDSKEWIASFQKQERERTGISSLKVGYNKVFGYYIEVTKPNIKYVPDDYLKKQTLANSERFYTPELKEKENMIISADEKIQSLEYDIFSEINSIIASYTSILQETAGLISQLDVLVNFAEIAVENDYTRPKIEDNCQINIENGRHPVVEQSVSDDFVDNDCHMDCNSNQFLLITGPNMAGKSTYMRQNALITIMAQAGSFVPASKATIGLVDRVFTRVGASDNLASGQSTFMVEMVELANILNNATSKSLILLDEIGRGTSTFDGYSIARAVIEHIHDKDNTGVRTLFATHYHQLTELQDELERLVNYHIAVKEKYDNLIFLRKIVPGATDRSYGIEVAKLAGVPHNVINRARIILNHVEDNSALNNLNNQSDTTKVNNAENKHIQTVLFPTEQDYDNNKNDESIAIANELKNINPDEMTPIDALNKIYELHRQIKNN